MVLLYNLIYYLGILKFQYSIFYNSVVKEIFALAFDSPNRLNYSILKKPTTFTHHL